MTIREPLVRSVRFEQRGDSADEGDGLTLDGYAAVFGEATEIDSWEGTFSETIRKGAFRKSIRERTPVMQFDHGRHPLVGSIPIGSIEELAEDDHGLRVRGRISDNWLMEPIRDSIREGAVTGMSFRFEVMREEWRDSAGKLVKPDELASLLWEPGDRGPLQRTLIELRLHELGPVVFPAYAGTSVGVRAREIADTVRSDDDLRRDVRAALARQAPRPEQSPGDLDDPETRREVAYALLGAERSPIPVPAGGQPVTGDAPPTGHPSPEPDAPPADGHPSTTPTSQDSAEPLRSEISDRLTFMRAHLASIADKDI